jgi:hypothetical protein
MTPEENESLPNDKQTSATDDLHDHVLTQLVSALKPLSPDARARLFRTLATFFEIPVRETSALHGMRDTPIQVPEAPTFSEDRSVSPKQFIFEKKPTTDVERVTCLAYYLTHYRSTPHFKTLDISKLNTEAAQIKFSNPAVAVDNASKAGFLVPASKGQRQISSVGELYVQALPDRTAARDAVEHARRKRNRARTKAAVTKAPSNE